MTTHLTRERAVPLAVLVGSLAALLASVLWVAGGPMHGRMGGWDGPWHGEGWNGWAMHAGTPDGAGPLTSMDDAARAANAWGARSGWHAAEVMSFSDGYYAELADADGALVTEVLLDPATGAVRLEPGPAMMWNTVTGMRGGSMMGGGAAAGTAAVTADDAVRLADRWLAEHASTGDGAGTAPLRATEAEHFPGYWTLHTVRAGAGGVADPTAIVGMLSVDESTGAVWPHTWHGRYLGLEELDQRGP